MTTENKINIFEAATKLKLRFESNKGLLTIEQLWDLPLQARDDFSLDAVAQAANAGLKTSSEESFVVTKVNPAKAMFELKLEIVKHIIADKIASAAKTAARQAKAEERRRLFALLDEKNQAELGALSKDEIMSRLAALEE